MKYLLLIFCITFSLCAATSKETMLNAATRKIVSISYRSNNQGDTVALIQLSDGSVWKWAPDFYSENLLRCWDKGDEVLIQAINHPGYGMKNLSKPHYNPIVTLTFNSYPLYPTIVATDTQNGMIELSDKTKWNILYDFNKRTLVYWAAGDRILAVKGVQNNFELINLDIPYENRCQIERFMEVCPSE